MSSRLGPACLAAGVVLIGAAVLMAAMSNRTVQDATSSSPAVFSTGFLIWSGCGALGLIVGLIAARRAQISPPRHATAVWESFETSSAATPTAATPTTPAGARFGSVLETVEGSV